MNHERNFKYIGVAATALLLIGLGGWYVFIQRQTTAVNSADQGRGFSIGIPSFLGSRSSTAANTGNTGAEVGPSAASQELGNNSSSAFLRFLGIGESGVRATPQGKTVEDSSPQKRRTPRFWRVNITPVAGASFLTGSTTKLRYVERATGNVFDVDAETGDSVRVTNTLIPKVYEAFMAGNGVIIELTLSDDGLPVTLGGKISTTTQDGIAQLETTNLGSSPLQIATQPASSDILMLSKEGGSLQLLRAPWNAASPKVLLSIPGGDFRIFWPSARIVLAEKAGSGIRGSAFAATTSLIPLVRNVPGLTVLPSPSSDALLFSSDDGARVALFSQVPTAGATSLEIQTVADKCVWAPQGPIAYCAVPQGSLGPMFLDRWYRGEAHTEDVWYTVNTSAGKAEKLFTIDTSQAIDVESPSIDSKGEYLSFINARDKSLWMLRISEN